MNDRLSTSLVDSLDGGIEKCLCLVLYSLGIFTNDDRAALKEFVNNDYYNIHIVRIGGQSENEIDRDDIIRYRGIDDKSQ